MELMTPKERVKYILRLFLSIVHYYTATSFQTYQCLISLEGSCRVIVDNGKEQTEYILDSPRKCLILAPEDWHILDGFKPGTILLVCASEYYNESDYIFEGYSNSK